MPIPKRAQTRRRTEKNTDAGAAIVANEEAIQADPAACSDKVDQLDKLDADRKKAGSDIQERLTPEKFRQKVVEAIKDANSAMHELLFVDFDDDYDDDCAACTADIGVTERKLFKKCGSIELADDPSELYREGVSVYDLRLQKHGFVDESMTQVFLETLQANLDMNGNMESLDEDDDFEQLSAHCLA